MLGEESTQTPLSPHHQQTCKVTFPEQLLVEKDSAGKPHPKETGKPHPQDQKEGEEVSPREQLAVPLDEEEEEDDDEQSQEEGEEGVGVVKQEGFPRASFGIASFLNVSEVASLCHCSVEVGVVPSTGPLYKLLDGEEVLPHPTPTGSETSEGGHMSPSSYLEICNQELKFPDADIIFASKLYDIIDACSSKGISLCALQGHQLLCSLEHSLTLDDHITSLVNFDMVSAYLITPSL